MMNGVSMEATVVYHESLDGESELNSIPVTVEFSRRASQEWMESNYLTLDSDEFIADCESSGYTREQYLEVMAYINGFRSTDRREMDYP